MRRLFKITVSVLALATMLQGASTEVKADDLDTKYVLQAIVNDGQSHFTVQPFVVAYCVKRKAKNRKEWSAPLYFQYIGGGAIEKIDARKMVLDIAYTFSKSEILGLKHTYVCPKEGETIEYGITLNLKDNKGDYNIDFPLSAMGQKNWDAQLINSKTHKLRATVLVGTTHDNYFPNSISLFPMHFAVEQ